MSLLSRYVLGEILKVMFLTCGVLVTVIAFGAAIRPLAQNRLGPIDTIKYIGLATVPMLQFALPISAGFAATIVLHRLASDNEIQAMSTSGLSYGRILRPVTLLGAMLVATMLVIVFQLEPRFWVLLRATVTRDAARMFVATVQDGRAFTVGGLQIYADDIVEEPPPPGSTASARLRLAGVAAVQFDGTGALETEFTAEFATVDVYRTPGGTYLKPALMDATVFRDADGALVTMPRADPDAVRVAEQFQLVPKLMTLGQMRRAVADPTGYEPVATRLDGLLAVISEADAWRAIDEVLRRAQTVAFDDTVRSRRFEISGAKLVGERLVPVAGDSLRVRELRDGRTVREATATGATIGARRDADGLEVRFDLGLAEPTNQSGGDSGRWPLRLGGLTLAESPLVGRVPADVGRHGNIGGSASDVSAAADVLAARGAGAPGPTARLEAETSSWRLALSDELVRLERQVTSQIAERIAMSVSAMLLVLLGAALAIWRRRALPLEIYVLAFIPAVLNNLLLSSGSHMVAAGKLVPGMATLWSGNAMLATIVALAWVRMARH